MTIVSLFIPIGKPKTHIMYVAVVPIPGCRNPARLEENANAGEIALSEEDVQVIRQLAKEADKAVGPRYPLAYIPEGDCIKLTDWKGE